MDYCYSRKTHQQLDEKAGAARFCVDARNHPFRIEDVLEIQLMKASENHVLRVAQSP